MTRVIPKIIDRVHHPKRFHHPRNAVKRTRCGLDTCQQIQARHARVAISLFTADVATDLPALLGLVRCRSARVRADIVFFETAAGGAVFSTGSIAWCCALSHNGYHNNVSRLTGNVLRRFLDPKPFDA
jgi:hypothetical protein